MHVGIDTVTLGGEGFTLFVRKGDRVRAGDLLLSFDLDLVARRARSLITPVIVTNAERFRVVRPQLDRRVASGDVLFELEEIGTAATATREGTAAPVVSEALVVEHAHGIHARPAGLIARVAKTLPYDLEVRARGRSANPKSAVALMALGVRGGDELVIVGFDMQAAAGIAEIARVVRNLEAAPGAHASGVTHAPVVADSAPATLQPGSLRGVIASRGFAIGAAARFEIDDIVVSESGGGIEAENAALDVALGAVRTRLLERARTAGGAVRGILEAHLELIEDPELLGATRSAIRAGKSAGFAWRSSIAGLRRGTACHRRRASHRTCRGFRRPRTTGAARTRRRSRPAARDRGRQHPGGAGSHAVTAHRYRHHVASRASRSAAVGPPRMWPYSPRRSEFPCW